MGTAEQKQRRDATASPELGPASASEIIANAIGGSIRFFNSAAKALCIRDVCGDQRRKARASTGVAEARVARLTQVLHDVDQVMRASIELVEASGLLFKDDREELPAGLSPIVRPELVARYVSSFCSHLLPKQIAFCATRRRQWQGCPPPPHHVPPVGRT